MAYDTCPHKWSYQTWNHAEKTLRVKKIPLWFGNIKVWCKDSIYQISVKLMRAGEKNMFNLFVYKRGYSLDIKSFRLCSMLNPDSSICMNCCDSPVMALCCMCFLLCRGYLLVSTEPYLQLCNHSRLACYLCVPCSDQFGIACILKFCSSWLWTECQRSCHAQILPHLGRL